MKIVEWVPRTITETPPPFRLVYLASDGWYSGWTGQEYFGRIRPLNGGWAVTCWSTVMVWVYGNPLVDVCFGTLEEAVKELDSLLDVAEQMGEIDRIRRLIT